MINNSNNYGLNLQKRKEFHQKNKFILRTLAKILTFFLLFFSINSLKGQDIHFSQYFNSPLNLNPALTGDFEGDWRIVGNYRNQWKALALPYRTSSVSYDRQFYLKQHHISAGLLLVNDESGNNRLKTNKIFVSAAYHRTINNNSLSAGLQIGYVSEKVVEMTLPSSIFDEKGKLVPQPGEHLSYLDVNFGVNWQRKIGIFEPEVGVSLFHVNHPKESFFNDNSRLPLKNMIHVAVRTNILQNFYVKPGFFTYIMKGSKDLVIGSDAGYTFQGNQYRLREARAGIYWRNGLTGDSDAMIALFGVQVRNLDVNISYDFNVSSLSTYTHNRGAFEISFIFKSISTILKTFTIPCERI